MSQGNPWILQTTPSSTIQSVAFGNGIYVAVGTNGNVITSPDGITWTTQASGNTQNWRIVNFGNGIFCACNANASTTGFMTSPDGITWTTRTIPLSQEVNNVAFGNGVWIGSVIRNNVGRNILRSTDNGVTWTSIITPISALFNTNWTGLAYGNGIWVTTANRDTTANNIMISLDNGITWTIETKPTTVPVWAVAYGNGKFIASSSSTAQYFISTNGTSWTQYTFPLSRSVRGLVYANGVWVAVGLTTATDSVFYSTNQGLNWTVMTTPSAPWTIVCFGNGLFVASKNPVATTNAIMTWTGLATGAFLLNIL